MIRDMPKTKKKCKKHSFQCHIYEKFVLLIE